MYFSYHAVAKRLIREGKLTAFKRVERWGSISPAFVLFFTDHRPMPIREARVPEYVALIEECEAEGRGPSE